MGELNDGADIYILKNTTTTRDNGDITGIQFCHTGGCFSGTGPVLMLNLTLPEWCHTLKSY